MERPTSFSVVMNEMYCMAVVTGIASAYVKPYLEDIISAVKKCDIREAYLFGSASTDAFQHWRSDIDIGVVADDEKQEKLMKELHSLGIDYRFDVTALSHSRGMVIDKEILKGVRLV